MPLPESVCDIYFLFLFFKKSPGKKGGSGTGMSRFEYSLPVPETVVSRGKRPCHSSVLAFVGRAVSCVTPQEDSMKKINESSEDSVVIITHQ